MSGSKFQMSKYKTNSEYWKSYMNNKYSNYKYAKKLDKKIEFLMYTAISDFLIINVFIFVQIDWKQWLKISCCIMYNICIINNNQE